jgi:hypothetical protein
VKPGRGLVTLFLGEDSVGGGFSNGSYLNTESQRFETNRIVALKFGADDFCVVLFSDLANTDSQPFPATEEFDQFCVKTVSWDCRLDYSCEGLDGEDFGKQTSFDGTSLRLERGVVFLLSMGFLKRWKSGFSCGQSPSYFPYRWAPLGRHHRNRRRVFF